MKWHLVLAALFTAMLTAEVTAQNGSELRRMRELNALAAATPITFPAFNEEQTALLKDPGKAPCPGDRKVFPSLPPQTEAMDSMHLSRLPTLLEKNRYAAWLWIKWVGRSLDFNDSIEAAKRKVAVLEKQEDRELARRSVQAQEDLARAIRDAAILRR